MCCSRRHYILGDWVGKTTKTTSGWGFVTTKKLRTIPFHCEGSVKESPTAPWDTFIIANATDVARQTGSEAVGACLVDTSSRTSPRSPLSSATRSVRG